MKRQAKSYWCGVASVANALEVLGIRRSQRELERLCHVDPDAGTNEDEMQRALYANGLTLDEYSTEKDHEKPCDWLWSHITERGPAIICVDNDEHWVTVIGHCVDRWLVFDPSRNVGIEVHDNASLCARWVNSDGIYYGIGVSK